jgi:hypothetical protein
MVGSAEGRAEAGGGAIGKPATQGVEGGHLQRLVRSEVGEQPGKRAGKHRLPRPGRPEHEEVVPSGRGDLQRALGERLASDGGEIDAAGSAELAHWRRHHRVQGEAALKVRDRHREALHADHLRPLDQGRLGGVLRRDDQPSDARRGEAAGHREHPDDAPDPSIERQLTDAGDVVEGQLPLGAQQRHRDGQIKAAPLLGDLCGRQVDRHPPLREVEAGVADGGTDPLARLLDRPVGEADDGEARQPVGHVHLHGHRDAGEPLHGTAYGGRYHTS